MHSPIYILALVGGLSGLWLLWDRAIKGLLLDMFRERVFTQRYLLFRLGMTGKLSFDSEVYRQVETLLCGLLQFAHNVTFLTFMFSKQEQEKARPQQGYVDVSKEIMIKIEQLEPGVQDDLFEILLKVRRAILLYVSFTSLMFVIASAVLAVARFCGVWRPERVTQISDIVEREAYRAEMKRTTVLATA